MIILYVLYYCYKCFISNIYTHTIIYVKMWDVRFCPVLNIQRIKTSSILYDNGSNMQCWRKWFVFSDIFKYFFNWSHRFIRYSVLSSSRSDHLNHSSQTKFQRKWLLWADWLIKSTVKARSWNCRWLEKDVIRWKGAGSGFKSGLHRIKQLSPILVLLWMDLKCLTRSLSGRVHPVPILLSWERLLMKVGVL